MLDAPAWSDDFPDPAALREDTDAMAVAVSDVLQETLPEGSIDAIHFKGSAVKPWDSPLDYVPELSDVDLHLRIHDGVVPSAIGALRDVEAGLARHAQIAARFQAARPTPVHLPRVQVIVVNELEQMQGYVPSPPQTVRCLYGASPPQPDPDPAMVRTADRRSLVEAADEEVIAKAAFDLLERQGHHLFHLLRLLSWRVSPIASRALSVLGADYVTAWAPNRTTALRRLADYGSEAAELAGELTAYYTAAWDAYRTGWHDADAGRRAFRAGVGALRRGRHFAETANE